MTAPTTAVADDAFSLERFEFLCYSRRREPAARELVRLLVLIDRNYGRLDRNFSLSVSAAIPADEHDPHLLTRLTSAISALFSDPCFHLSPDGFGQLINFQRWLSALFGASHFVNCDHILRSLNLSGPDANDFQLRPHDLVKFCLLYSPESELPLDAELLWQQNRPLAAALFMALLSPRLLGSQAAHSKREALLAWLPEHLTEIGKIDAAQPGPGLTPRQVRCHFLVGQAQGLLTPQVQRLVRRYVPQAQVYPHQPYQQYLDLFNQCDMFLSPLPFGNTNGIIDAFTVGLPGVCKTGPEVFEHIDEGLFARVGLPAWTIAATVDDYIRAAVRIACDFDERAAWYRHLADPRPLQRLFEGRADALGTALAALVSTPPDTRH